jgi:hypothetical protein
MVHAPQHDRNVRPVVVCVKEVRFDPALQVDRFADIQGRSACITHDVNAGALRETVNEIGDFGIVHMTKIRHAVM